MKEVFYNIKNKFINAPASVRKVIVRSTACMATATMLATGFVTPVMAAPLAQSEVPTITEENGGAMHLRIAAVTKFGSNKGLAGIFDPEFYAKTYPDVVAVLGSRPSVLYKHFITYGIKEYRKPNADFNVLAYAKMYPDLIAAFGDNIELYYYHYALYGKAEGRLATNEAFAAFAEALKKKNATIASLSAEKTTLEGEVTTLQTTATEKAELYTAANTALTDFTNGDYADYDNKTDEEKAELDAKKAELQSALTTALADKNSAEEAVTNKQAEVTAKEGEITRAGTAKTNALAVEDGKIAAAESTKSAKENAKNSAETELQTAQSEFDSAKSDAESAQSDLEQATMRANAAYLDVIAKESEKRSADEKVDTLTQQTAAAEANKEEAAQKASETAQILYDANEMKNDAVHAQQVAQYDVDTAELLMQGAQNALDTAEEADETVSAAEDAQADRN